MTKDEIAHPPIVLHDEWLVARKKLLGDEKELTRHFDRVNAERRRLPMVKIEKDYVFDGPNGKSSLKSLFDERRQLIAITSCSTQHGRHTDAQAARVGSTRWAICHYW